jgi:hypothetical protein
MVQALAFAEIFLGLILADTGYKGVTITAVVKGEAGETVAPNPLGTTAAGSTASTPGGAEAPGAATPGTKTGLTREELLKGSAFGPSPLNSPNGLGGFNALSPAEQKQALAEGATG